MQVKKYALVNAKMFIRTLINHLLGNFIFILGDISFILLSEVTFYKCLTIEPEIHIHKENEMNWKFEHS